MFEYIVQVGLQRDFTLSKFSKFEFLASICTRYRARSPPRSTFAQRIKKQKSFWCEIKTILA